VKDETPYVETRHGAVYNNILEKVITKEGTSKIEKQNPGGEEKRGEGGGDNGGGDLLLKEY